MANGLRNLLQDPWGDSDLFAESIPHLLHWDLAFLHVLQLDSDLRPKGWGFRIEAWKRLLYLFLLGELKIERLRLEEPLSRYTRKLGINNVSLLKLNNRYVGVLSYTVLVRPLPDCTSEEADSLPDLRMSRPAEIAKALEDLTKQLDGGEIPQIRGQLREFIGVLREQLGDVLPAEQLNSELEPVQLLTKIGWDRSDDLFEELEIPVASGIGPVCWRRYQEIPPVFQEESIRNACLLRPLRPLCRCR